MRRLLFLVGIGTAVVVASYLALEQITKPQFALEVDATRDTTDIGILYRIRMTNVGAQELTGIIVELGENDIQEKSFLGPGQSYYFYPDPDTKISTVKVRTNEGIRIETDYRSPIKVLGLPGAGR